MPKMKTHRGAAKRFRVTKNGKVIKNRAFHRHMLECKTPKKKRVLRHHDTASKIDTVKVKKLLPYA